MDICLTNQKQYMQQMLIQQKTLR